MISPAEFSTAYTSGFPRTVDFLRRRFPSLSQEVEDLAQLGWTKGWAKRAQFRGDSKFPSWVNTIALNVARNELRRAPFYAVELTEELLAGNSLPEIPSARKLLKGIPRLARIDRSIFLDFYERGKDCIEIAKDRKVNYATVKVKLMRVRDLVKEKVRHGD